MAGKNMNHLAVFSHKQVFKIPQSIAESVRVRASPEYYYCIQVNRALLNANRSFDRTCRPALLVYNVRLLGLRISAPSRE